MPTTSAMGSLNRIKNGFRSLSRGPRPTFHLGDAFSHTGSPGLHRTITSLGRKDSTSLDATSPQLLRPIDAPASKLSSVNDCAARPSLTLGVATSAVLTGHQRTGSKLDILSPFRSGRTVERGRRPSSPQSVPWLRGRNIASQAHAVTPITEPSTPTPVAQTVNNFGRSAENVLNRMANVKAGQVDRNVFATTLASSMGGSPMQSPPPMSLQESLPERPSTAIDISRPTNEARKSQSLSLCPAVDVQERDSVLPLSCLGAGSAALSHTNASQLLENLLAEVQQQSHGADQEIYHAVPTSEPADASSPLSCLALSVKSPTVADAESATLPLSFPCLKRESVLEEQSASLGEDQEELAASHPPPSLEPQGPSLIRGMTSRRPQKQGVPISPSPIPSPCSLDTEYRDEKLHLCPFEFCPFHHASSDGASESSTCDPGLFGNMPTFPNEDVDRISDKPNVPSAVLLQDGHEDTQEFEPWELVVYGVTDSRTVRLHVEDQLFFPTIDVLCGTEVASPKGSFPGFVRYHVNQARNISIVKPPPPLIIPSDDNGLSSAVSSPCLSVRSCGMAATGGRHALDLTVDTAAAKNWALSPSSFTRSPYRSSTVLTQEHRCRSSDLVVIDRARPASSSFVECPTTPAIQHLIMHLFGSNVFGVDTFKLTPLGMSSATSGGFLTSPSLPTLGGPLCASPHEDSYLDMDEEGEEGDDERLISCIVPQERPRPRSKSGFCLEIRINRPAHLYPQLLKHLSEGRLYLNTTSTGPVDPAVRDEAGVLGYRIIDSILSPDT